MTKILLTKTFKATLGRLPFLPPSNDSFAGHKNNTTRPLQSGQNVFLNVGLRSDELKNVEQGDFAFEGLPIHYYVMRAKKERGVVIATSGLKSDMPLSLNSMKDFNDKGLSVMVMALPNMKRNIGFMPFFERLHNFYAYNPNSPAHRLFDNNSPKILYGHSTSGQLLLKSAINKKKQHGLYRHYIAEAPFLDTANTSLKDNRVVRKLFNVYSSLNKDRLPSETLAGAFYLNHDYYKQQLGKDWGNIRLNEKAILLLKISTDSVRDRYLSHKTDTQKPWHDLETDLRVPTHEQIFEVRRHGHALQDTLTNPQTGFQISTTIIHAYNDPFACPKSIADLQKENLSVIQTEDGGHRPLSESSIKDQLLETLLDKIAKPETSNAVNAPLNANLRQRGAGGLNPVASVS